MESDKEFQSSKVEPDLSTQKLHFPQIALATVLLLCVMTFGTSINQLTNDKYFRTLFTSNIPYPVTTDNFTKIWSVGCLYSVFGVFGAIFASWFVEKYGRRPTALISLGIAIFSNILGIVSLKVSIILLIVCRAILGFSMASIMVVTPLWMVELLPRRLTTIYTPLIQLFVNLGIIFSAVLSIHDVIEKFFGGVFVFPIIISTITLIVSYFIPESVKWRMLKKQSESLIEYEMKKLRGDGYSQEEHRYLQDQADTELAVCKVGIIELCKERASRMAVIGVTFLFILQQLSGINFVLVFFPKIVIGTDLEKVSFYNLGLTCSNCLFSLLLTPFVSKFPRKFMLIVGFLGMAVGYVIVAIFLSHGLTDISYVSGSLAFVLLAFQTAPGPIPWFLAFETFQSQASASIQATGVSLMWISNTFTYLLSPYVENLDIRSVMLFFFTLNSMFCVFVSFMVVETKKRNIAEIQDMYGKQCNICG